MTTPDTIVLKCACCETPLLEVKGDAILIREKHHGKEHTTVIQIAYLVGLVHMQQMKTHVDAVEAVV